MNVIALRTVFNHLTTKAFIIKTNLFSNFIEIIVFLRLHVKEIKMKNLFIVMLMAVLITSCAPNDPSKENVALIQNYIQAVENLDYDAMDLILDDSYVGVGPSRSDSVSKTQAITNWKSNVENLYEKISYSKSKNIAVKTPEGEWVSNWADLTIVYKESHETISILANTLYLIENGKIIKSITFYNEADALEQLGYVFINPEDLY